MSFRLACGFAIVCLACSNQAADPSPDRPCTLIGCTNGLHVLLSPDAGWPSGQYVFRIEADGASQSCSGMLPLPACGTSALRCTGPDIAVIGESGCALPAAQHGFAAIMIESLPAKVRLSAERDGAPLFEESFDPVYVEGRPNGPQCGPICRSASKTIAVVFR